MEEENVAKKSLKSPVKSLKSPVKRLKSPVKNPKRTAKSLKDAVKLNSQSHITNKLTKPFKPIH